MEHDQLAIVEEPEQHTVGSILCRCRQFSNISLEEAAEATKIGKTYLRALEEDRFQDLPSPAYLKGFLRTYASYLGLQSEELIQLAGQQEATLSNEPVKTEQARQTTTGFSLNWQRLLLPAVLLVALIASSLFMVPSPPKHTLPPPPQPQPQPVPTVAVQPTLSSVRGTPAVSPEQQEPVVEKPAETTPPKKPLDGFMVRMKVNRNSSLSVTIDDAASQGYDLTSGDLIEWKATRTIALDLTDAASVEIELNGTPLKLQAAPGKPAYIVLDAHGIKQ
ncbi:MAG: helix-turn-helix domain-containing protein [Geobacteraceae bacterium]|nr:helix-turn-helix domain-containing protein [Geobacteraceae bacterium]